MKRHLNALKGFPFGIMILAISYIIIYVVDGENTYLVELSKLTDIRFLIAQLLYSGIVYIVIFEVGILFNLFQKKYSKNLTWGAMLKFMVATLIIGTIIIVISDVLDVKGTMSGEVGSVVTGIATILLVTLFIVYIIYQLIEEFKINKALKERNSK